MGKKIVCRCQDVTEDEIKDAIRQGYTDLESLKRFTGVMTGPCQGKTCLSHVLSVFTKELGKNPGEVALTTQRPPTKPIFFSVLAGETGER
jgi:bacterioferritin-associated ferredoxin